MLGVNISEVLCPWLLPVVEPGRICPEELLGRKDV